MKNFDEAELTFRKKSKDDLFELLEVGLNNISEDEYAIVYNQFYQILFGDEPTTTEEWELFNKYTIDDFTVESE